MIVDIQCEKCGKSLWGDTQARTIFACGFSVWLCPVCLTAMHKEVDSDVELMDAEIDSLTERDRLAALGEDAPVADRRAWHAKYKLIHAKTVGAIEAWLGKRVVGELPPRHPALPVEGLSADA